MTTTPTPASQSPEVRNAAGERRAARQSSAPASQPSPAPICSEQMRAAGNEPPRTCPTCKLGPCVFESPSPARSLNDENRALLKQMGAQLDQAREQMGLDSPARSDMPDKNWYSKMAEKELAFEGNIEAGSNMPDTERTPSDGEIYAEVSRRADPEGHAQAEAEVFAILNHGLAERTPSGDGIETLILAYGAACTCMDERAPAIFDSIRAELARRATAGTEPLDQAAFETQAAFQGASNFTQTEDGVCWNGWFPATYLDPVTELAWRIWANKPERATAGTTAPEKPFAGPGAWFSVDILGNPMRQYAPGKWENAVWPSSVAGTTAPAPAEIHAIAWKWAGKIYEGSVSTTAGLIESAIAEVLSGNAATAVPGDLTDERIDNELESARECIVEGFGYKYDEADLAAAIRRLASNAGAAPADAKPKPEPEPEPKPEPVEITREGRMFWHTNCPENKFKSGIMRVEKDEPHASLIRCGHCGKAGYYPVGGAGTVCAAEVAPSHPPVGAQQEKE